MKRGGLSALQALAMALFKGRRAGMPGLGESLMSFPRLIRATKSGTYKGTTWGRLGLMVLGALYIVSPIDLLPESVLGPLGFTDDAMVVAWLAGALLSESKQFLDWESTVGSSFSSNTKDTRYDSPPMSRSSRVVEGEVIN